MTDWHEQEPLKAWNRQEWRHFLRGLSQTDLDAMAGRMGLPAGTYDGLQLLSVLDRLDRAERRLAGFTVRELAAAKAAADAADTIQAEWLHHWQRHPKPWPEEVRRLDHREPGAKWCRRSNFRHAEQEYQHSLGLIHSYERDRKACQTNAAAQACNEAIKAELANLVAWASRD